MKTLFLALRVEWSNKSQFFIHASIISLILYFCLQYYGAYYGAISDQLKEVPVSITAPITELVNTSEVVEIQKLTGFQSLLITAEEGVEERDNLYQFASFCGDFDYDIQLEGRFFSDEDINNSSSVVIIPYSYRTLTGKDIGDTLQINDTLYSIIGVVGEVLNGYMFVPYTTLYNHFTPESIEIVFDADDLNDNQLQTTFEQSRQILGNIEEQWNVRRDLSSLFASRKIESILYFALGILSLIFVFSYILKKRQYRMSVYTLNGCSITRSILLTSLGSLGVFNIGFASAYLLGTIINKLIFTPIFSYDSFYLDISDFLFFYIITVFLYLAIILVYITRFCKSTAIGIYRRRE